MPNVRGSSGRSPNDVDGVVGSNTGSGGGSKKGSIAWSSSPLVPGGNISYATSEKTTSPTRVDDCESELSTRWIRWYLRGSTLVERSSTSTPPPPEAK